MKKLLFVTLFLFVATNTLFYHSQSVKAETKNLIDESARELLLQAENAHFQLNLELEKNLLQKVLEINSSEEDQVIALRRLATLDWRFYSRYDSAENNFARALSLKAKKAETLIEKSRMETALEKYGDAFVNAKRAITEAEDEKVRKQAVFALATIIKSELLKNHLDNLDVKQEKSNLVEKERLREVFRLLLPIVKKESGQINSSKLLLTLSLSLENGPNALMAWRSYFRFQEEPSGNTILSNSYRNLKSVLSEWSKNKRSKKSYEKLAQALADSRMFEDAALVIQQAKDKFKGRKNSFYSQNDIVEYANFCRRLEKITDEYYRQKSINQGKPDDYRKEFWREAEALWGKLNPTKDTSKFSPENFQNELKIRFGAIINLSPTAGVLDLHMGHSVIDEKRTVTQYGRTAEVKFISLDSMVSDGFQSWVWDGRAQHGGWGEADLIIQVRPAYGRESLNAWNYLSDPVERKKIDDEIIRENLTEIDKARKNPYAFLPGLQKRLLRQGWEQFFSRLKSKRLIENDLQLAFLSEYEKVILESSIFAHEGRHSIDARLEPKLTTAEKEFRAKLSEISFSTEPRLVIASVFNATIGDNTPHGMANLNLIKGIVSWMEANRSSIKGVDISKPFLPQFDLLTDDQIRTLFRSMDPFFNNPINNKT